MILRFYRTGGRDSPPDAESVELSADGTLSGWRSVSTDAVGSFAGELPDAEAAEIVALAGLAVAVEAPTSVAPPGAPAETIELSGGDPVPVAGLLDTDDGPWPRLVAAARALLDRVTDLPRAAIGLTVERPGLAELSHRGAEPLLLDLSEVRLRVTAWRGYYEPAGEWSGAQAGPTEVTAGPGWVHDLALGPVAPTGTEVTLHASATFAVVVDGRRIPVRVSHAPLLAG